MVSNNTFTLVDKVPKGRKAIIGRWMSRWKLDEKIEIVRTKSRMVMKGFTQESG